MKLKQQRILLAKIVVELVYAADGLGYYLVFDYCRRCPDCKIGHPDSAHKEARALDFVLYHKETGEVCKDDTVFAKLHDIADTMGGAARISGDFNHVSVADPGQVR